MAAVSRPRAEPRRDAELGALRFLRETYDELRKVVWPTPQELYRYTVVVIAVTVIIALFIGAIDYGLTEFARRFIYGALSGGSPGAPIHNPGLPTGPHG